MGKICNKCEKLKEYKDYHKDSFRKDGYYSICKDCRKSSTKKYRENNKEIINESNKSYREYYKVYGKKNVKPKNDTSDPDLHKKYRNNYFKKKYAEDELFRFKTKIRNVIKTALNRKSYLKKNLSIEILGCSFEFFKLYLESKFESWMTWENYGLYNGDYNFGWDIDHIIPLKNGKSEEEVIKLNHFSNLIPLCSKINRELKDK